MVFFIDDNKRQQDGNTDYIEFQKGKFDNQNWKLDSLYIRIDVLKDIKLQFFLKEICSEFDIYGINEISKDVWKKMYKKSVYRDILIQKAVSELNDWVTDCFEEYEVFTIIGI